VAQASYTAPGVSLQEATAQVAALTQQIAAGAAALAPSLHSAPGQAALVTVSAAAKTFGATDARIRDRLNGGDSALAASVIFGESRRTLAAMRGALDDIAASESGASEQERRLLEQRIWSVVGATAAAWFVGLFVLASVPASGDRAAATPSEAPVSETVVEPGTGSGGPGASVDLAAAADVCASVARMTSADAVPDVLARAAAVLDASGIILWMGAGEELFAAGAFGYDPAVIARLGPIHRSADNATADAWRAGEVRTVKGDMVSNGAVVTPMWGPHTCIGVLAAEIRRGRESDTATRAVASMIAAQFAAALSAWPSAGADQARRAAGSSRSA
jgi:hypothetical protein